jgi:lipopolysaccharide transport system permease protein
VTTHQTYRREVTLTARPDSISDWLVDMRRHTEVLRALAAKDFRVRYKRATFGITWALLVPALQATILAIVFAHVVKSGANQYYPVYVISGVVAFSYLSLTLPTACTSIVDGSSLTDKVWFPRALLPIVPCLSNSVGLVITTALIPALMPAFGAPYRASLLLAVPGLVLLVAFTLSLSLVLAALNVYFRDVKFIVQASLMVWMYVTPIVYQQHLLGRFADVIDANPLTGVVTLMHMAFVGPQSHWVPPVLTSVAVTVFLLAVAAWTHARHDRLFVDLL